MLCMSIRKPPKLKEADRRARLNLLRLMVKNKWTQAEVARRCGIEPAQVWQWLHNRRGFGPEAEKTLSKGLGLPWGEFLKMPDEPEMNEILDGVLEYGKDSRKRQIFLRMLKFMEDTDSQNRLETALSILEAHQKPL